MPLDLDDTPDPSTRREAVLANTLLLMFPNFKSPRGRLARAVNTWPGGQPEGKVSDDIVAVAGQAVEGLGRS